MKKKVGRPLKYQTVEELERLVQQYFIDCDANEKPYTISGLALALNMSRQDLLNYQAKAEFVDTIKTAKQRCENYAEEQLFRSGNVAGVIFNLKNNYGYKDKQEVEAEVSQTIKVIPPTFD